ncbi:MAG: acyl-CoA thioesterase [Myxococcota bacterium]
MADPLSDYPIVVTEAVRWGDMDAFGHVNNTVYFRFFESARIAFFAELGIHTSTPEGVGPILHSTSCRFRAPVTFPDSLRVGARVADVGEDRIRMEHLVYSERLQKAAATGDALVVTFDYANGCKAPLPPAWREHIDALGR